MRTCRSILALASISILTVGIGGCGNNGKTGGSGGSGGTGGSGGSGGSGGKGGDGGTSSDNGSPPGGAKMTTCPHASDPPPATGVCSVTAGSSTIVITGVVLTRDEVFSGGQVQIDGTGVIQCVGCDCDVSGATEVACPKGVVSPGLINTHDHITYTNDAPGVDSGERYEQRNDWRKGLRGHTKIPNVSGGASNDDVHFGELRFLLSGTTSTVGSGGATGLLRNLDKSTEEEAGLTNGAVYFDTFPLGDTSGTQLASGCAYPSLPMLTTIKAESAYEPHVSEGIDDVAHNEFVCLDGGMGGVDIALPESAYIHAVALGAADYAHMGAGGASLIWSPRSNIRLYGNTAMAQTAWRLGLNVALGTDWLPSGSMNMSRELACADSWNQTYLDGFFQDEDLWLMVTRNAARATHDDKYIGALQKGLLGDIAIFDGTTNQGFRAVVAAQPQDVQLVLRSGKVLYGDAAVVTALGATGCDALTICNATKSVCLMGDIGETLATLQTNVGAGFYPAFFCGTPMNEPTCVPSRMMSVSGSTTYGGMAASGDKDGDGVPDAMDDCPTVFNPIRPLDSGKQADADGDGAGDACDTAPLDKTTK
jgi:large repetitive protein